MVAALITMLFAILIVAVFYWLLSLILSAMGSPPQFKQAALVICVLVLLLLFMNIFFGVGGSPWRVPL